MSKEPNYFFEVHESSGEAPTQHGSLVAGDDEMAISELAMVLAQYPNAMVVLRRDQREIFRTGGRS